MSLFKIPSLLDSSVELPSGKSANAIQLTPDFSCAQGKTKIQLSQTIGELMPGQSKLYHTEGAWSNIDLLEHILNQTGSANVYIASWAISEEAIRKLIYWLESGLIVELYLILDRGVRNRKPEIYQQCVANFKHIKFVKCHAKFCVVQSDQRSFTFLGSANFTANPRLEAGMILENKAAADFYMGLIKSKIDGE